MSSAPHGFQYLYKYRDTTLAKLILKNRTIRASHPALFNDLLDGQITLGVPRMNSELKDCLAAEYLRLAYLNEVPDLIPGRLGTQTVMGLRHLAASMPKEALAPLLRKQLEQLVDRPELESEAGEQLRQSDDAALIVSLSANPSSLPMWYHYADRYRGVVLAFDCKSDPVTMFSIARKVNYTDDVPEVCSREEWVKVMTGQQDQPSDVGNRLYLTKSKQWEYEEEYRFMAAIGARGATRDLPLVAKELGGVILGPQTPEADAKEITTLAREWRPECRLWRAHLDYRRFGFALQELK